MKKTILSVALICASLIAGAQSFSLTYPFTAVTVTTGVTDPTPAPTAVGVTSGSFLAVGTPTASTAAGRFSFTTWPTGATTTVDTYSTMTGAINPAEYYEIIITPTLGYTVALNTIDFTVQRSGTGIRSYVVKTSADGFTSNLPASTGTSTALSIVGTNEFFWNLDATTSAQNGSSINLFGATITSSVSFRFYGWNSEGSTGSFSIDNVVINGASTTTASCPSPTITSITSNGPICSGSNLSLQCAAITSTGTLSYSWAGTGSFSSLSVSNPTVTGAASGNYSVTVSNGCATTSTVISVVVNPTPTLSVSATSSLICVGQMVTLTASGATSYTWTNSVINGVAFSPTITATYTVTGSSGTCSNTAVKTISVSTCTGVDENLNLSSFTIYPNPNAGIFNIQANILPAIIVIYDITGKKIITKTLTEMETSINISELNNGIYFSNISNDKSSMNYKIIISK